MKNQSCHNHQTNPELGKTCQQPMKTKHVPLAKSFPLWQTAKHSDWRSWLSAWPMRKDDTKTQIRDSFQFACLHSQKRDQFHACQMTWIHLRPVVQRKGAPLHPLHPLILHGSGAYLLQLPTRCCWNNFPWDLWQAAQVETLSGVWEEAATTLKIQPAQISPAQIWS